MSLQNDIFNFIATNANTIYGDTHEMRLPFDNEGKPVDNVCAVEFGQGVPTNNLCGVTMWYTQPITIHTRGFARSETLSKEEAKKASRENAEALSVLLSGIYGVVQGTTRIITMVANLATLTGVDFTRGQAYQRIVINTKYGSTV